MLAKLKTTRMNLQETTLVFKLGEDNNFSDLKISSDRRNQILHDLMVGKVSKINDQNLESSVDGVKPSDDSTPEMSEWEKRLESKK